MATKWATASAYMMLGFIILALVNIAADVARAEDAIEVANCSGLPAEQLTMNELNSLSSGYLAERLQPTYSLGSQQNATETDGRRCVVVKKTRTLRATVARLLRRLPQKLTRGAAALTGQFKHARRPMVLLSSTSASTIELNEVRSFGWAGRLHSSPRLLSICKAVVLTALIFLIAVKQACLVKLHSHCRIQLRIIAHCGAATHGVTAQLMKAELETSALKAALIKVSDERDALHAQVARLLFERDNFKDSLDQLMSAGRGSRRMGNRIYEDSDILGTYADREWKLRQRLAEADSEHAGLVANIDSAAKELSELRDELNSLHCAFQAEEQKSTCLRIERDLYVKFAKLSATQKRHMAQLIADIGDRHGLYEAKLIRQAAKLDTLVVETRTELKQRLSTQQGLFTALDGTLHNVALWSSGWYGWFADDHISLRACVDDCRGLKQDLVVEHERLGQLVENSLNKIESVSKRLRGLVCNTARPKHTGETPGSLA